MPVLSIRRFLLLFFFFLLPFFFSFVVSFFQNALSGVETAQETKAKRLHVHDA